MISIISQPILDTAIKLNERDALIVQGVIPHDNFPSDESFWADTEGVSGLKGKDGQPMKGGGSYYSHGPYPRNRRILADVALSARWDVERARELEKRCINSAVAQYADTCRKDSWDFDLSDPENPMKNGKPFTFQHIAWDRLSFMIYCEVGRMDERNLAAVKAGVLDKYAGDSKKGPKALPQPQVAGKKRKSAEDVACPVAVEEIESAQEAIDKKARYEEAIDLKFEGGWRKPELLKRSMKAYMVSKGVETEEICTSLGVKEGEWESFLTARKEKDLLESRVYLKAKEFLESKGGKEEDKENERPKKKARN